MGLKPEEIDHAFMEASRKYIEDGMEGDLPLPTNSGLHKLTQEQRDLIDRGWAPVDAPMFIDSDGTTYHRRKRV